MEQACRQLKLGFGTVTGTHTVTSKGFPWMSRWPWNGNRWSFFERGTQNLSIDTKMSPWVANTIFSIFVSVVNDQFAVNCGRHLCYNSDCIEFCAECFNAHVLSSYLEGVQFWHELNLVQNQNDRDCVQIAAYIAHNSPDPWCALTRRTHKCFLCTSKRGMANTGVLQTPGRLGSGTGDNCFSFFIYGHRDFFSLFSKFLSQIWHGPVSKPSTCFLLPKQNLACK